MSEEWRIFEISKLISNEEIRLEELQTVTVSNQFTSQESYSRDNLYLHQYVFSWSDGKTNLHTPDSSDSPNFYTFFYLRFPFSFFFFPIPLPRILIIGTNSIRLRTENQLAVSKEKSDLYGCYVRCFRYSCHSTNQFFNRINGPITTFFFKWNVSFKLCRDLQKFCITSSIIGNNLRNILLQTEDWPIESRDSMPFHLFTRKYENDQEITANYEQSRFANIRITTKKNSCTRNHCSISFLFRSPISVSFAITYTKSFLPLRIRCPNRS